MTRQSIKKEHIMTLRLKLLISNTNFSNCFVIKILQMLKTGVFKTTLKQSGEEHTPQTWNTIMKIPFHGWLGSNVVREWLRLHVIFKMYLYLLSTLSLKLRKKQRQFTNKLSTFSKLHFFGTKIKTKTSKYC